MLKANWKLVFMSLGLFFIFTATLGTAAENMFVCDLECSNIGPKPANTSAKGSVVFLLDDSKQELAYRVLVEKVEDAYMAHLHIGPAGKEGKLAAWLYPGQESKNRIIEGQFTGTLAEGVIRPENLESGITFDELIESLQKGNAYANVHTKKFVMGAIRGQVYSEGFASRMERMPAAAGEAK